MTTSGVFRSTVDVVIECDCGYAGWVEATEDTEDMTFTWSCPDCGYAPPAEELR